MIERTFSVSLVADATEPYKDELDGFDPLSWMYHGDNIALTDGENVSLFGRLSDGIYTGHYFFVARGKAAVKVSFEMLDYLFKETDIQIIRGLTPLHKLGARWMNRRLGFKGVGAIDTPQGPCELFVLTKKDYTEMRKI